VVFRADHLEITTPRKLVITATGDAVGPQQHQPTLFRPEQLHRRDRHVLAQRRQLLPRKREIPPRDAQTARSSPGGSSPAPALHRPSPLPKTGRASTRPATRPGGNVPWVSAVISGARRFSHYKVKA
jgi:hypothetical protein